LAARGLLAAMLEPMHKAEPYGHLLIRGQQPDYAELADIASCTLREVKYGLEELIKTGVLSQTQEGILFSRRMVRDAARRLKQSKDGKRGGHPLLVASQQNEALTASTLKGGLKGSLNPIETRDQRLEARDQRGADAPRPAPLVTSHRQHACCGRVCLHSSQFEQFTRMAPVNTDTDRYVREWFTAWDTRYQHGDRSTQTISDDSFDFWRARWKESHPQTNTNARPSRHAKWAGQNPNAEIADQ
jgi:hypothetical protein